MRLLLAAGFAAALLAAPTYAAGIDPLKLVLQESEVPRGYQHDEDNSGPLPNALLRGAQPERRDIIARAGRVDGYATRYVNYGPPHWRYVVSWVDVFRTSRGAKLYFDWSVERLRRETPGRLQPVVIGDGGLVQSRMPSADPDDPATFVIWREGRVTALVVCQLMNDHRKLALALARIQQRRIAATLR
jgi:hypothetical protein